MRMLRKIMLGYLIYNSFYTHNVPLIFTWKRLKLTFVSFLEFLVSYIVVCSPNT